jgi:beta-N-acetylglucosaminidase
MNKRAKMIAGLSLVMAIGLGTWDYQNDKSLRNELAQQKVQTQQVAEQLEKTQEKYDSLFEEAQKAYDEKQKLQQEVENLKAFKEKVKREQSVSRGLSRVTYGASSRVDVKSGVTANLLNKAFVGTEMEGLGQAFVDAENTYEINAIFLASIAALESGWGKYDIGRNNLFGFGAHDGNEGNATAFSSKGESIMKVAKALRRDYLNSDGRYFGGATPQGINKKYCSSDQWKYKVTNIMNTITRKATN